MKTRPIDVAIQGWRRWAANPDGEWADGTSREMKWCKQAVLEHMGVYARWAIPELLRESRSGTTGLRLDSARARLGAAYNVYQHGAKRVHKRVLKTVSHV